MQRASMQRGGLFLAHGVRNAGVKDKSRQRSVKPLARIHSEEVSNLVALQVVGGGWYDKDVGQYPRIYGDLP
jgi:hypothetical protein